MLPHSPSVQVRDIPEDGVDLDSDDDDKVDKDERLPQSDKDKHIVPDNEYSDSEDEGEGGRRDNRSFKTNRKRPRMEKEPAIKNTNDSKSSTTTSPNTDNSAVDIKG